MDVLHEPVSQPRLFKRVLSVGVFAAVSFSMTNLPTAKAQQPLRDPDVPATAQVGAAEDEVSEDIAPYVVFVAKKNAHVRSGPGEEHYRTDPLRRGQELEVYVETADGWLGVRPPEKSFCWVPASATDWSQGRSVATVTGDETIAWIGTRLGSARRYRWQVQLDPGEPVNVVGSAERSGKPWLRITPPSGEFRWIHVDDVADNAEQLLQRAQDEFAQPSSNAQGQIAQADELVPRQASVQQASVEASAEMLPSADLAADAKLHAESGRSIVQSGDLSGSASEIDGRSTSRRGSATATLTEVSSAPQLSAVPVGRPVADRAIQLHRGANASEFADRGAVIGSGLREDLFPAGNARNSEESGGEGTTQPLASRSAAAASTAAEAIVAPIRKVTDVVANFISPPRMIEIDGSRNQLAPKHDSFAQRPWLAGSGRPAVAAAESMSANAGATLGAPAGVTKASLAGQASLATMPSGATAGVAQVGFAQERAMRLVPLADVSKVEDEVSGASSDALQRVLSRLMADAASASEVDPLLRRAQALLDSADVNSTSQTRQLIETARKYRSVAVRRDGRTRIDTSMPTLGSAGPAPAASAVGQVIGARGVVLQTIGQSNSSTDVPMVQNPASQGLGNSSGNASSATAASTIQSSTANQSNTAVQSNTAAGTLVRVYSSRPNMPPFVLTDDAGLTVAYVTPYPGVNLSAHLNSRVAVRGNEKLLQGMAMRHIMVDAIVRR